MSAADTRSCKAIADSATGERLRAIGVKAALLWLCAARAAAGQDDSARQDFLGWAVRALHPLTSVSPTAPRSDLAPLRSMVGVASIVALSEGAHAGAEPLEFRNRVFAYLAEELGFTAIAIESGITESQVVHDYVRGGHGEIAVVLANGFGWTFDRFPQNEALVRWMRAYNDDPRHRRKLNFYGFDVSGSPGNPLANRGLGTALQEALGYLDQVDTAASTELRRRIDPRLPMIRFDARPNAGPQYAQLSQEARDQLTAAIADLISLLERRQARYEASSSARVYRWARRNAVAARQVDGWLRRTPIGSAAAVSAEAEGRWRSEAGDLRDRAMADNLRWIVEQEGSEGKVLVFAARNHVSTVPLDRGRPGTTPLASMGTYLKIQFGDRLVTIGNLVGGGAIGCGDIQIKLPNVSSPSVAWLASHRNVPTFFLLDLRSAPPPVAAWLNRPNDLWAGLGPLTPRAGRPFDVVFFTRALTPACPP